MNIAARALLALTAALTLAPLTACEPRTVEECASDLDSMREVVEDVVEDAAYCETDADCAIFDPSNACEDRCPVAINTAEFDHAQQRLTDGELSYCVGYGESCGYISVTCEARLPTCSAGRCEMVAQ